MSNIKVDKRNKAQMESHKKIIVDVTRNIIKDPSLKICEEIKRATDYYTKNNPVQVMQPDSLVEWVSTLKNIIDDDGVWYLNRKREFAREVIIKDAYFELTGKKINIIQEDGPKPGQISVEDVCPLEAQEHDEDDLTPEELEDIEVDDSWSDTNPPDVVKKPGEQPSVHDEKAERMHHMVISHTALIMGKIQIACDSWHLEDGKVTMVMPYDEWYDICLHYGIREEDTKWASQF